MSKKVNEKDLRSMDPNATWKEMSRGGTIASPGNAELFKTGDWRSMKPIWHEDKCKQCLMCYPVCPDTSILVDKETGKMSGIDYDHCKGCGICANVCPFKAIEYVAENESE
ncbi:MAG TPA: 4Fe-4S binding protein [Sedimentibacter sp.]|nr:4Fe-4S binding protein [Sedimentibacter sp.]